MAAVDVEVHTTIDRPRREVAAYCCDPGNVTAWNANINAVQWDTAPPVALPAHGCGSPASFLGRRLEYTYEVVGADPGAAVRDAIRARPVPDGDDVHVWEDAEAGGTWMTLRNRGAADGVRRALRHRSLPPPSGARPRSDLARLKAILEGVNLS